MTKALRIFHLADFAFEPADHLLLVDFLAPLLVVVFHVEYAFFRPVLLGDQARQAYDELI